MVRRKKEDALETRSQIIDAAEKCFHQKGLSRTSLAEIATAAGVTRGAIYWHFQDKVDVLEAMLDRARMPLQPLESASLDTNQADPLGRLRELICQIFTRAALDPVARRLNEIIFHKCEYTDDMGDLRQRIQSFRKLCNDNLEGAMTNAVNRKQLPENLDIMLASRCVHGFISGTLDQWLLQPDDMDLAERAGTIADVIIEMLKLSPSLRKPAP